MKVQITANHDLDYVCETPQDKLDAFRALRLSDGWLLDAMKETLPVTVTAKAFKGGGWQETECDIPAQFGLAYIDALDRIVDWRPVNDVRIPVEAFSIGSTCNGASFLTEATMFPTGCIRLRGYHNTPETSKNPAANMSAYWSKYVGYDAYYPLDMTGKFGRIDPRAGKHMGLFEAPENEKILDALVEHWKHYAHTSALELWRRAEKAYHTVCRGASFARSVCGTAQGKAYGCSYAGLDQLIYLDSFAEGNEVRVSVFRDAKNGLYKPKVVVPEESADAVRV